MLLSRPSILCPPSARTSLSSHKDGCENSGGAEGMLDAVGHLRTLALVRQPENRTQGAVSLTRGSELYLAQGFAPPQMLRVARKPRPGVRDTPGVPRWLSPKPPNKSFLDELRPEPKHTRGRELPPPFIAP